MCLLTELGHKWVNYVTDYETIYLQIYLCIRKNMSMYQEEHVQPWSCYLNKINKKQWMRGNYCVSVHEYVMYGRAFKPVVAWKQSLFRSYILYSFVSFTGHVYPWIAKLYEKEKCRHYLKYPTTYDTIKTDWQPPQPL